MKFIECSRLPGDYKKKPAAYARFLHAAPGIGPVDIYANGELVASALTYTQTAGFYTVIPCVYTITVYEAKTKKKKYAKHAEENLFAENNLLGEQSLVTEACVELCPGTAVTIAIVGAEPCVSLLAIPQDAGVAGVSTILCDRACVRFVHLSPNTPPLTVTTFDGVPLFRNVPYKAHTRYRGLNPGRRMFRIVPPGSRDGITTPEYIIDAGKAYTLYAVGLAGDTPPLTTILTDDSLF